MRKRRRGARVPATALLMLAVLLAPAWAQPEASASAASAASSNATAPAPAGAGPATVRPTFRQDEDLSGLVARSALALVVVLAVGAVVVVLLRRRAGLPAWPAAGSRRLKLVEQLRLGPRTVLHLVELDGRPLLLGQHGDKLTAVPAPPAEARPPTAGLPEGGP